MKKLQLLFSFFLFVLVSLQAQNNGSIETKYFVKKNEVLIRFVPTSKAIFDVGVKNGYRITRSAIQNGIVTQTLVLTESLKPYSANDTLSWLPIMRKNDNGIIAYKALYETKTEIAKLPAAQQNQQNEMIHGMLLLSCNFDAAIAKACGLFFRDTTISNSLTYSYKIELLNPPKNTVVPPTKFLVDATKLSENTAIKNLSAVFKNKNVKLKWKASDYQNSYSGYIVERSEDSVAYQKINKSYVVLISSQFEKNKEYIYYNDTFPELNKRYYYRIRGVNFFGELSAPSNVLVGMGYKSLRSAPIIDSVLVIANQKVQLNFGMSDVLENVAVKKFIVLRSSKEKDGYSALYEFSAKGKCIDEKPTQSNYYKLLAVTWGGDSLYSYSKLALIIDTIPPSAPRGLKAIVDKKGVVTITWDKNPESDLQGYKLFKANTLKEEFVQLNEKFITSEMYSDKLNLKTLSKKIYYALVATDNNYNNSVFSVPVLVQRPDTIAPSAPIITSSKVLLNGVKLSWINSVSEDVKKHVLSRRLQDSTMYNIVKEWSVSDTLNTHTDTLLQPGYGYYYRVEAVDSSENRSYSAPLFMKYENGFRKKIVDATAQIDKEKNSIQLNWVYKEANIEKFIIYRGQPNKPIAILKTVDGAVFSFSDKLINMGNIYEYRIKAIFDNGAESIISDSIRVEY
ncbi:MAG: hypothetical protein J0M08_13885 [Bacteroidetes bacterium]|nr:hypothetical protein [Bacteroidota bacterium]